MAIWEFRGSFLPSKGILKHFGEIPKCLPEYYNGFEQNSCIEDENYNIYYKYWENINISSIEDKLKKLFNIHDKSSLNNMRVYGYQNGIKIEVSDKDSYDDSDSEDIYVYIDIRNLDILFLKKVLYIMNSFDCLFISEDKGKIIKTDLKSLISEIKESKRYIKPRFKTNKKEIKT